MRFEDDNRYYDKEEDNDLWDDELELTTDDDRTPPSDTSLRQYAPDTSSYSPYDAYDAPNQPENHTDPVTPTPPRDSDEDGNDDYYSEPEPTAPEKPRRGGFFRSREEDEEEGNDYYDSAHETETPRRTRTPKTPRLDPEDPDYWMDDDDSPLNGLIPNPGKPWIWKLVAAVILMMLVIAGGNWLFRPYADSAVKYGYIRNMERRGLLFKTFEGVMIPYKELGDPDPLYFRQLPFSVPTDSLAAQMKRMMLGGVPVRVEYETYNAPLPWKGEATMVVVKVDTADTRKILPPEYRSKL